MTERSVPRKPDGEDARVYGRRKGRPLRASLSRLIAERLPAYVFDLPEAGLLDPQSLFTHGPRAIWLEIGFGGGEHLAWQAVNNPHVGLIGCEIFLNGIATALRALEEAKATNVRLWPEDVRPLLERLAPRSLDRVLILFPDPWPKARHHRRRLINDHTLDQLARLLRPGGELRLATDDEDYLVWMLDHLWRRRDAFRWTAESAKDWRTRDWPETRYETKARAAGRQPTFLTYRRLG
ncbi:MAG TPA: tRNA (guanosine(46)-N7)-methyltransferase TrmB [Kiloniellales bacterium]|nr:tRNA (guanosine(46)-N7)-methyltransferase TrmB [Kiloniellales bacterium]